MNIVREVREIPRASAGLYPILDDTVEEPHWSYETGPYGNILLKSDIRISGQFVTVYFDTENMRITDSEGRVYTKLKTPSPQIISQYFEEIRRSSHPLFANDCTGTPYLINHPLVQLKGNFWIDKATGKTVHGLKVP